VVLRTTRAQYTLGGMTEIRVCLTLGTRLIVGGSLVQNVGRKCPDGGSGQKSRLTNLGERRVYQSGSSSLLLLRLIDFAVVGRKRQSGPERRGLARVGLVGITW